MRLLNLKPFALSLVVTLALGAVACSVESTDPKELLLEKGSRSASITSMIDEINSIENNIDHLNKASMDNTKVSHVQALLSGIRPEGQDELFKQLDELNGALLDAQDTLNKAEGVWKLANDQLKERQRRVDDASTDGGKASEADMAAVKEQNKVVDEAYQSIVAAQKPVQEHQKSLISTYLKSTKVLGDSYQKLLKSQTASYVPTLITAYNQGDCKRIDVIEALRKLGKDVKHENFCKDGVKLNHCTVVDVMLDMIETDIQRPPRAALNAANTLEAWNVTEPEYISKYIAFAKDDKKDFELRDVLIRIITKFADASHQEFLFSLLNKDSDYQPITYTGYAADALGKIKANNAIDRLIECLWLNDARGRDATPSCRLSLNRLDPKLVYPALVKTLKRQNAKVEERALRYNYAHTGLVDAKAAEILGDLGNPQAGALLVQALLREDKLPEAFAAEPETATFFTKGQVQKTVSIARALAILGAKEAVKPLLDILKNKDKLFEYKLSAVQQLAYLGDESATPELLALFNKVPKKEEVGDQDMRVQYAKSLVMLLKSGDKSLASFKKGVEEALAQAETWHGEAKKKIDEGTAAQKTQEDKKKALTEELQALRKDEANRPDRKKIDAYEAELSAFNKAKKAAEKDKTVTVPTEPVKPTFSANQQRVLDLEVEIDKINDSISNIKGLILEINREQQIYETWKSSYTEVKAQITALEKNGNTIVSWVKALEGENIPERTIAAYVLSRKSFNSKEAADALIKFASDKDPVVKDVVLFGLSRHASKSHVDELKAIRAKQHAQSMENPGDASLSASVYSLDLLIAHIEAI